MRDSVLPLSVSSLQLYNFGSSSVSEAQVMPSLDISSFCWDSIAFSNYQMEPPSIVAPAAGFHIAPPHHQQESFNVTSYDLPFDAAAWYGSSQFCDTTSSQSMVVTNKLDSAAENENGLYSKQGRKRSIEVSSIATKNTTTNTRKRKKSSTSTTSAGAWHQPQQNDQSSITTIQELKQLQVPARRSQKLSDKITALQKLVSPYGKTDTASVLQEASLYIKLLQKQIQILSNRALFEASGDLSNEAWTTTIKERDGELSDLRDRGLCLVPLSTMTQKFADLGLVMDPRPYQEGGAEV
ncbi:unnamed protein product [Linum trigynum]|uniref:BHLH domain-containing protein n=1 Tax=Linum trigynum TaxID=586398 RepID=A0AAV2EMT3_9ROSI